MASRGAAVGDNPQKRGRKSFHPLLAVAAGMRLLLDKAILNWDDAWQLTQRTLAYTNHTLLLEAPEK
ncbi:MAG TPA: glycogen/starch/alpha-glucan phosphorylase [Verrucomicrobiae bacterium]